MPPRKDRVAVTRIAQRRMAAGLTQRELARRAEIPLSTLQRIEQLENDNPRGARPRPGSAPAASRTSRQCSGAAPALPRREETRPDLLDQTVTQGGPSPFLASKVVLGLNFALRPEAGLESGQKDLSALQHERFNEAIEF